MGRLERKLMGLCRCELGLLVLGVADGADSIIGMDAHELGDVRRPLVIL